MINASQLVRVLGDCEQSEYHSSQGYNIFGEETDAWKEWREEKILDPLAKDLLFEHLETVKNIARRLASNGIERLEPIQRIGFSLVLAAKNATGEKMAVRIGKMDRPPFPVNSRLMLQPYSIGREGQWWWAIFPWAETGKVAPRELEGVCLRLFAEGLRLEVPMCGSLGRVGGKVYVLNPREVSRLDDPEIRLNSDFDEIIKHAFKPSLMNRIRQRWARQTAVPVVC